MDFFTNRSSRDIYIKIRLLTWDTLWQFVSKAGVYNCLSLFVFLSLPLVVFVYLFGLFILASFLCLPHVQKDNSSAKVKQKQNGTKTVTGRRIDFLSEPESFFYLSLILLSFWRESISSYENAKTFFYGTPTQLHDSQDTEETRRPLPQALGFGAREFPRHYRNRLFF